MFSCFETADQRFQSFLCEWISIGILEGHSMRQVLHATTHFDLRNCLGEQFLSLLRVGDFQPIPDDFDCLLLKMFLERMDDCVQQILALRVLALPLQLVNIHLKFQRHCDDSPAIFQFFYELLTDILTLFPLLNW